MSVQTTKKKSTTVIAIAVAAIVIAATILAFAVGGVLKTESVYAKGNPSEASSCSSCCHEEKAAANEPAKDEPESCCADASEVHKETGHV